MELHDPWAEKSWWQRLSGGRRPTLVLHHFGIDDKALAELEPIVNRLGRELGAVLGVELGRGDALLVDAMAARSIPAQLLESVRDERPLVSLWRDHAEPGQARGALNVERLRTDLQRLLWQRQGADRAGTSDDAAETTLDGPELLAQERESVADSAFDTGFDSRYPGTALADLPLVGRSAEFLQALHRARFGSAEQPLVASYGQGAKVVLDFGRWRALLEPAALVELRLGRRLPMLDHGAPPVADLKSCYVSVALWELGRAAGSFRLHQAPAEWLNSSLVPVHLERVQQCSANPLYLEMARVVRRRAAVTPALLRRECRCSLRELRSFLQACLFLNLIGFDTDAASGREARADGAASA